MQKNRLNSIEAKETYVQEEEEANSRMRWARLMKKSTFCLLSFVECACILFVIFEFLDKGKTQAINMCQTPWHTISSTNLRHENKTLNLQWPFFNHPTVCVYLCFNTDQYNAIYGDYHINSSIEPNSCLLLLCSPNSINMLVEKNTKKKICISEKYVWLWTSVWNKIDNLFSIYSFLSTTLCLNAEETHIHNVEHSTQVWCYIVFCFLVWA